MPAPTSNLLPTTLVYSTGEEVGTSSSTSTLPQLKEATVLEDTSKVAVEEQVSSSTAAATTRVMVATTEEGATPVVEEVDIRKEVAIQEAEAEAASQAEEEEEVVIQADLLTSNLRKEVSPALAVAGIRVSVAALGDRAVREAPVVQEARDAQEARVVPEAALRIKSFLMLRPDRRVPWGSSGGFDRSGQFWALH